MHNINIDSNGSGSDIKARSLTVARLGIDGAAAYQMDLIADRLASGDARWAGISEDDMREALQEMGGAL